jgi:O-antigen/teichoic acid export membrane protein
MIRRFVKDAVIYALPMFLARAIGLILLPIYTRELGPTDFGFIEFVAAASAIFLLVLPLEINQAVARLLPESEDFVRQNKILSSALWFTTIVFVIFGMVVFASKFQILKLFNLPSSYAQYFGVVCVSFLISSLINLLQVQFRFTSQARSSVAINLTVVLFNMFFVIYFSTVGRLGIEQFFLSQIISGLFGVIIGLVLVTRKYGQSLLTLDAPVLRELLKFSLPIVLSSVGVVLSGTVDKMMVGSYVGLTDLGYYGVAARFSAIVALGFYVISTAMTPIVYREHEKPETKKLIALIFNVTIVALLLLLAVISVYANPIIVWFAGDKFAQASNYLFYLMLSTILANLYIFFLGMDIAKNTKLLSKINLASGSFGALGSIIFVPIIGIWGAILSTLVANAARFFGYVYFSQKIYLVNITFRWPLILTVVLVLLHFLSVGKYGASFIV